MASSKKERKVNTLNFIVSFLAIIASLVSIVINAILKQDIDIKLMQYQLMNRFQEETLQVFYDYENYLDTLVDKYKIKPEEPDSLFSKISLEEEQNINQFIYKINLLLAKMFIILPDIEYRTVRDTVKLGPMKIRDLREGLIVAMRKTQFPKTEFTKQEDIRLLYKVKHKK